MKPPPPVCCDFETEKIQSRPAYPPKPIGVSIAWPGKAPRYRAFGHVAGNDCSAADAKRELAEAWRHPGGLLFHHAKFDLDVAETHFGLKPPPPDLVEDTVLLSFLDSPDERDLGLKVQAVRLLGVPADERDEVAGFLVGKVFDGVRATAALRGPKSFMNFLKYAPPKVVGKYANGDVLRTRGLHKILKPRVLGADMGVAYDRERKLVPLFLKLERRGLRVDLKRLRIDVERLRWALGYLDDRLRTYLAAPNLNLDAPAQLVAALIAAGKAEEGDFLTTETGKLSGNKESLEGAVDDVTLRSALRYRGALDTALGTFMGPWLGMAEGSGGLIYTSWNQTRNAEGGKQAGTRTGRPSATWFLNTPKRFRYLFRDHAPEGAEGREDVPKLPRWLKELPGLPNVRGYVVPSEKGHVLGDRDYNQQEFRILGHFDGGALLDSYRTDPWIDFHDHMTTELVRVGRAYPRRTVKEINFGIIYGQGDGSLAKKTHLAVDETKELKRLVYSINPGLKEMYAEMKRRAKAQEPIRTWGGRVYYCEPPVLAKGRVMEFDYKMVNTLVQGSAADATKEAMLRYDAAAPDDHLLLLQVYDQMLASFPRGDVERGMRIMREAMDSVEFDVPMLSEGKVGLKSWGELRQYDKKGVVTWRGR